MRTDDFADLSSFERYNTLMPTMFAGSLYGKWPHTAVWAALLALRDAHGNIVRHERELAAMFGLPLEELRAVMADFESPDPESRCKDFEGRKLVRIPPERGGGWHVTSHERFDALVNSLRNRRDAANRQRDKRRREVLDEITTHRDQGSATAPTRPAQLPASTDASAAVRASPAPLSDDALANVRRRADNGHRYAATLAGKLVAGMTLTAREGEIVNEMLSEDLASGKYRGGSVSAAAAGEVYILPAANGTRHGTKAEYDEWQAKLAKEREAREAEIEKASAIFGEVLKDSAPTLAAKPPIRELSDAERARMERGNLR